MTDSVSAYRVSVPLFTAVLRELARDYGDRAMDEAARDELIRILAQAAQLFNSQPRVRRRRKGRDA